MRMEREWPQGLLIKSALFGGLEGAMVEKFFYGFGNIFYGKWFGDGEHIVQIAGNGQVALLGDSSTTRNGDNRKIRSDAAEIENSLQPVFYRHDHIGYDQIAGMLMEQLDSFLTIYRRQDFVSIHFQNPAKQVQRRRLIIDYKDTFAVVHYKIVYIFLFIKKDLSNFIRYFKKNSKQF